MVGLQDVRVPVHLTGGDRSGPWVMGVGVVLPDGSCGTKLIRNESGKRERTETLFVVFCFLVTDHRTCLVIESRRTGPDGDVGRWTGSVTRVTRSY